MNRFSSRFSKGGGGALGVSGPAIPLVGSSNGGFLSGDVTFTRASSGMYMGIDGLWKTANSNVPRYQYTGGVINGLIVEAGRTNSALYARDFTNAAWVKSSVTAALDAVGIDGASSTASTLTSTGADGTALQTVTIGSAAYTFSVFVKRKTGTGTISITDNNGTNYTDITSLIQTGAWTRVSVTRTQANPVFGFKITTSGDEILVDYAALEAGGFYSTPILTTSAAVARASDVASVTLASKSWFTADPFTLYVDFQRFSVVNTTTKVAQLDSGSLNDSVRIFQNDAAGTRTVGYKVSVSSVDQVDISFSTGNSNISCKIASAVNTNNFAASLNGSAVTSDASGTTPSSHTVLRIGADSAGAQLMGTIKSLVFYNKRLSNNALVALTT